MLRPLFLFASLLTFSVSVSVSKGSLPSQKTFRGSSHLPHQMEHHHRSSFPRTRYPQPISIVEGPVHLRDPTIVYNRHAKEYIILSTGNERPYIQAGSVLGNASVIRSSYNPWAPDVTHIQGKYYAYYCVSRFGTQDSTIGVAVSSSGKEGSFHDFGELFSTQRGNMSNALDPSLVPGAKFLSYGSYFGGLFLAKLNDLTSVDHTSLPGIQIAGNFPSPNAIEGSFIYQRGGWFYLFISSGQCCGFNQHQLPSQNTVEYKILVGRSSNITGPYVDREGIKMTEGGGSVLLSSFDDVYAPGGQSVYQDPISGRDVMVFHYSIPQDANLIARLGMYYLDFSEEEGDQAGAPWPRVVNR